MQPQKAEIKVLLVDDHAMVCAGLALQLESAPGFLVSGTCGDAESAIDHLRSGAPDVVVMDIDMPGLDCFAACRTISAQNPDVRVIFLSAHHHDQYIDQALSVNAWGYVTKGDDVATIREAIRTVASGRVYFSEDVKSRLVARPGTGSEDEGKSRASTLSRRELEVLKYLASGMAVKEVAMTMHLSRKTVENHRSNIMAKLDIHDRVALARFAFREGLAPLN